MKLREITQKKTSNSIF